MEIRLSNKLESDIDLLARDLDIDSNVWLAKKIQEMIKLERFRFTDKYNDLFIKRKISSHQYEEKTGRKPESLLLTSRKHEKLSKKKADEASKKYFIDMMKRIK